MKTVVEFLKEDQGATAVEYAIIASLIAAVIAGTAGVMGQKVLGLFTSVNAQPW